MGGRSIDASHVSELIGAIYDCALRPDLWDTTLARIMQLLTCANCALYVIDDVSRAHRLYKAVGIAPRWERLMFEWRDHVTEIYDHVGDAMTRPLEKVFVMRRELSEEFLRTNHYYMNWAVPQGIGDMIQVTLMRDTGRLSACGFGRRAEHGPITDKEIRLIELLAPHLRRAVAISDLIDMKALELDALTDSLDKLAVGVVLAGEDGTVLRSNEAARRVLEGGGALHVLSGRLRANDSTQTARLLRSIEAAIGGKALDNDIGLGLALGDGSENPLVVHIMPISGGADRGRIRPRGVAAVFFGAGGAAAPSTDLRPIAEAFGLTRAEQSVLEHIVQGHSVREAASRLGIALPTAKTHMSRILAKTGTRRQPALMALVGRLVPPLVPRRNQGRSGR